MLIGNVGQDPEIRYLEENSTKVASIRLATTERYKDRNGELRENTEWHSVVAWRSTADVVEKYVKKGTQIYVEGRLRTRSWEDQNHNKRYTTEIYADTLQLLGRRQDNPSQQGNGYQNQQGGYQNHQGGYHNQQSGYQNQAFQNNNGYQNNGYQNQGYQSQGYQQNAYQSAQKPAAVAAPVVQEEEGDDLPF